MLSVTSLEPVIFFDYSYKNFPKKTFFDSSFIKLLVCSLYAENNFQKFLLVTSNENLGSFLIKAKIGVFCDIVFSKNPSQFLKNENESVCFLDFDNPLFLDFSFEITSSNFFKEILNEEIQKKTKNDLEVEVNFFFLKNIFHPSLEEISLSSVPIFISFDEFPKEMETIKNLLKIGRTLVLHSSSYQFIKKNMPLLKKNLIQELRKQELRKQEFRKQESQNVLSVPQDDLLFFCITEKKPHTLSLHWEDASLLWQYNQELVRVFFLTKNKQNYFALVDRGVSNSKLEAFAKDLCEVKFLLTKSMDFKDLEKSFLALIGLEKNVHPSLPVAQKAFKIWHFRFQINLLFAYLVANGFMSKDSEQNLSLLFQFFWDFSESEPHSTKILKASYLRPAFYYNQRVWGEFFLRYHKASDLKLELM